MPEPLRSRLKNAWNIFRGQDSKNNTSTEDYGSSSPAIVYTGQQMYSYHYRGGDRSIVNSIYNRIAMDVASVDIRHVRTDPDHRYLETIEDSLNACLSTEANIDQTGREMIQDAVLTLFDEGCIAIVPIETETDPDNGSYNIYSLRVGIPVEFFPQHVKVSLYDDRSGQRKEVIVPKTQAAIIQNPFYTIMNKNDSLMTRLNRKLNLLDVVDEQTSSGKLDLIIQLPYTIKSEARKNQAEERRKAIEEQLAGSKYGIAYVDATEHITQLNRSVENNLLKQVEYLTNLAYGQLGVTPEIMNGTADEKVMTNYNSRVIEPVLSALTENMSRVFITPTARTQGQDIKYFRDPFKLMPVSDIAEIADKFTRNEIATSNEIRQAIGMTPSSDPKADELRNANLSAPANDQEGYYDREGYDDQTDEETQYE